MFIRGFNCWGLFIAFFIAVRVSLGLITGGESQPMHGLLAGSPDGALAVANHPSRMAWWEGPPFGGGNYHFDYRGNTQALADVVELFAKVQSEHRYIVIHEGITRSMWLSIGDRKKEDPDLEVYWTFEFWLKDSIRFAHLILSPDEPDDLHFAPRLDIYTGGAAKWEEIKVPDGITVIDNRLAARGFTEADGAVAEGLITDLQTHQPIEGASVQMEVNKPTKENPYNYEKDKSVKTDAHGRWVFKNLPATGCRFSASMDQYLSRQLGYASSSDTPRWYKIPGGLTKPVTLSGNVFDTDGKGVPMAEISLIWITGPDGIYQDDYKCTADENGHFVFDQVPPGTASCASRKQGYSMINNMAVKITVPSNNQILTMIPSASLKVKVNFKNGRPQGEYMVGVYEKGQRMISRESAQVDANNIADLKTVLPGDYDVICNPNPTSEKQKSVPVSISLKPGEHKEIEIDAR